jgi:hypothetical protein
MTIKWGLSVSDWRDHAVDDHQDYPVVHPKHSAAIG